MRLFFLIMYLSTVVQSTSIKNPFYKVNLPKSMGYEKMNSSHEELSYADVFKITNSENKQVKFLMYLMANKLNTGTISESEISKYIEDIGSFTITKTEKVFYNNRQFYKVSLAIDDNITGIMYLTSIGNVLYRNVFMVPKKLLSEYKNEVDEIVKATSLLKSNWE